MSDIPRSLVLKAQQDLLDQGWDRVLLEHKQGAVYAKVYLRPDSKQAINWVCYKLSITVFGDGVRWVNQKAIEGKTNTLNTDEMLEYMKDLLAESVIDRLLST